MRCSIALALVSWFVAGRSAAPAADSDPALELFERAVRPVLVETCQKCHGAKKQEGDLRLDSREALLRGGDSGAAIVPGKPEESLLLAAIRQTGDLQMPPKEKLRDEQIAAFARWIELGAAWPKSAATERRADAARTHWAFQPVRPQSVPIGIGSTSSPAHPIDAFVYAKLKQAGMSPSPRAYRRTLIRRATVDVTGLPPTPEEVEAFERDDDPRSYARLVDRLLASPHYGEQWGRHWLDVARYSDTKGYVYDREERFWVHAWAYRDWVVRSLNEDMPYDRFLLLQIAADQAAPNDKASLAAMGFLTLGRRFLGVTHDIIDDRIDVVTRGTMGLTVSCARCHDHKYDPIPTRDYYSLYGVFQNCAERQLPIAKPTGQDQALRDFEKELQNREHKFAKTLAAHRSEWAGRVRSRVADYLLAQTELHKYPDEGFDQILQKDDLLPAFVRRWQEYLERMQRERSSAFAPWHEYARVNPKTFAADAVAVTAALAKRSPSEIHPLVAREFEQPPRSIAEVAQRYGQLFVRVEQQWQVALKKAAASKRPPPTVLEDAAAEALRGVLYGRDSPCEVPDEPIVHVEAYFDTAACEELWKLQKNIDRWLIESPVAAAYACALVDRPSLVPARVFKRGRPSSKGDEAPRQFLELLSGPDRKPFAKGSGRLELAQAIIDPRNPLTARVIVNRVWAHHFGAGLVRTPSDFGTRAEIPSHPELLDWLADWLVQSGWSLKQLHRTILLSETYQQSSIGPPDAAIRARIMQSDPENRLLWRMNERRLTFEELRDSMLSAANILDLRIGGKPGNMFTKEFQRRTLYGLVDRQFLPSTLRVFDFANPDLHIAQRSDTTVAQQALYFMNDELVIERAKSLARRTSTIASPADRVQQLYRYAYQRPATPAQLAAALRLVDSASHEQSKPALDSWQQLAQVLLATNEFMFVD